MLTVTLYKNCILNDSYSEVFDQDYRNELFYGDNLTAHEYYLSKLNNLVINCGETYVTNSGSINFDLKPSETQYIYEYNYMKLHDSNLPDDIADRYAFIDNITIVNTIAVVSYSEDIWANYSKKMNFRLGIISRSLPLQYPRQNSYPFKIPFWNLPLIYQSNNKPIIERMDDTVIEQHTYCIATIQLYDTVESGKVNKRNCYTVIFADKRRAGNTPDKITLCDIDDIIKLITNSSESDATVTTTSLYGNAAFRYEITKLILLPPGFLPEGKPTAADSNAKIGYFTKNNDFVIWDARFAIGNDNEFKFGKTYTIPGNNATDFTVLGIGPFNNVQQIDINGSNIDITINITCTNTTFDIYMSFQNKIINITDSFVYDVPIGVDTSETTQLKAMNREFQNSAYTSQQINSGLDLFRNFLGIQLGIKDQVLDLMDPLGASMSGAQQAFDSSIGLAKGINGMIMTEKKRNLTNAKLYTSNSALKMSTRDALTAAQLGLIMLKINPDNQKEVTDQIAETGYVVNEIIDFDIFKSMDPSKHMNYGELEKCIMKFDFVRMNGAFPQDIRKKLENILLNGFKLSYRKIELPNM